MNDKWNKAKKEIRAHGVTVTTSLKSCRLGCAGCVEDSPKWEGTDAPVLWQTATRWRQSKSLNHQNITPELALKIIVTLNDNGVAWNWPGKDWAVISIKLGSDE